MTLTASPDETPAYWQQGEFTVTCDRTRLDVDAVHHWLSEKSYWAAGVPRAVVERSLRHSLPFAMYHEPSGALVGFCRVITDQATFAYLADVFVVEAWRRRGLSKWLMECVQAHPDLQGLRAWMLLTTDAHGLYQQFGFTPPADPSKYMERRSMTLYNSSVDVLSVNDTVSSDETPRDKL